MPRVHTVGDTPVLTGSVGTSTVGAEGEIHIQRPDETVIEHPVDWTDTATGAWSADLVDGDLNQEGTHYLEVEVVFAGGARQTFAVDDDGREVTFYVRNAYA